MTTEARQERIRERQRQYRARKKAEKEAKRRHEALRQALVGPVAPGSELGRAMSELRARLLAGIANPTEARTTLADLAVRCKVRHDSLAAYLDSRQVEDRLDGRVLAIEVECSQQAQSYARLTRESDFERWIRARAY